MPYSAPESKSRNNVYDIPQSVSNAGRQERPYPLPNNLAPFFAFGTERMFNFVYFFISVFANFSLISFLFRLAKDLTYAQDHSKNTCMKTSGKLNIRQFGCLTTTNLRMVVQPQSKDCACVR